VEIAQPVAELIELARKGKLTLVYGAKDQLHNHAIVLKELLDKKLQSGLLNVNYFCRSTTTIFAGCRQVDV
jgi:hypothetical protein